MSAVARGLFSFEVALALFVASGSFSESPLLAWLRLDIPRATALLSLVSGVWLVLTRRVTIARAALIAPALVAALGLWMALSLAWAPPNPYGVQKTTVVLTYSIWSVTAGTLIAGHPDRIRRLLMALIALATWFTIARLGSTDAEYILASLGSGYLSYAVNIGIGITALFGLVVLDWSSGPARACGLLGTLPMLSAVLRAGGRGALAGLALSLPLLLLASSLSVDRARHTVRVHVYGIGLSMVTIFGFLVLLNTVTSDASIRRQYRTLERLEYLQADTGYAGRGSLATVALDMWYERPWLGHGVGSFPIYVGRGPVRAYPHNIVLEALCELGIVGGGIVIALVMVPVWRSLRALRYGGPDARLRVIMLALILYTLFQALKSMDLMSQNGLYLALGLSAFPPCTVPPRTSSSPGAPQAQAP
ncbi:MAG: O-antigen ligase family protein [candidate division WS1 bacterium]|nr:O-antigen ligase family protein [candidate division WS1 bacterium]